MRTKTMHWVLAAAVLLGLQLLSVPKAAQAQESVIDELHIAVNEYWHYMHYLQFVEEIYQQAEQIAKQVAQINNQLQALRKLSNPNWREVYDLLANLDFIMRQGQALAYSYKNIDQQFTQTFPGFAEVQNWPVQRQTQAARSLDTMRTGLDTVAEQFRHDIADQLFLEKIKAQMSTIHGHEEALELLATLEMYTAQELGVIKQSLAVGNNMGAVYYGHVLNREAQGEATVAAAFSRTAATNRGQATPGYSGIPAWWPYF